MLYILQHNPCNNIRNRNQQNARFFINDLNQLYLRHVSNNQVLILRKTFTCNFMVFFYASVIAVRSMAGCVWYYV